MSKYADKDSIVLWKIIAWYTRTLLKCMFWEMGESYCFCEFDVILRLNLFWPNKFETFSPFFGDFIYNVIFYCMKIRKIYLEKSTTNRLLWNKNCVDSQKQKITLTHPLLFLRNWSKFHIKFLHGIFCNQSKKKSDFQANYMISCFPQRENLSIQSY